MLKERQPVGKVVMIISVHIGRSFVRHAVAKILYRHPVRGNMMIDHRLRHVPDLLTVCPHPFIQAGFAVADPGGRRRFGVEPAACFQHTLPNGHVAAKKKAFFIELKVIVRLHETQYDEALRIADVIDKPLRRGLFPNRTNRTAGRHHCRMDGKSLGIRFYPAGFEGNIIVGVEQQLSLGIFRSTVSSVVHSSPCFGNIAHWDSGSLVELGYEPLDSRISRIIDRQNFKVRLRLLLQAAQSLQQSQRSLVGWDDDGDLHLILSHAKRKPKPLCCSTTAF